MDVSAFSEFSIIFVLAALLGLVVNRLRQPAILGYIICGLLVGPFTPAFHPDVSSIDLFSKIGITLLLFILGLELDLEELKKLGKVAVITGLGQIIFTSGIGYFICLSLGFDVTTSLYLAIGLTFSSTIIIIKILSQINQLEQLHGRISTGFLLVQDLVAIIILIIISTLSGADGGSSAGAIGLEVIFSFIKAIIFILGSLFLAKAVVFPLLDKLKREKEIVFITVIAWALLLATLAESPWFGFSIEIGGLVAGIALASRFESLQIESWTKPLRDFFILLFFVVLGLHVHVDSLSDTLLPSILLSLFVLVGNPLIVIVIMKFLKYSKKTSFMTSLAVAQISEFSLIVANFGFNLGHIESQSLTVLTIVGGITMTISTYFIYYNEALYKRLYKFLDIFGFKKETDIDEKVEKQHDVVLVGCHQFGEVLLSMIPSLKRKALIIDMDPLLIKHLRKKGYTVYYGELGNTETAEKLEIEKARLIVSTLTEYRENKKLITYLRKRKKNHDKSQLIIVSSNSAFDTKRLYKAGADVVIFQQMLGSDIIRKVIKNYQLPKNVVKNRTKQIEILNTIS